MDESFETKTDEQKAAGLYGGVGLDDYTNESPEKWAHSPDGRDGSATPSPIVSPEPRQRQQPGNEPGPGSSPFDATERLTALGVGDDQVGEFNQLGLNQKQAEGVLGLYQKRQDADQAAWEAREEEDLATLESEYGNGLQNTAKTVNGLLSDFDSDGALVKLLEQYRAQNHPVVFRFLDRIAQHLAERR